ncbi:enoyl-CoA hydratase [haloarchaeon 3A1-DGR]|nr:enoyl-CoA hydratase [haloarchaeon 3A1-DGR]
MMSEFDTERVHEEVRIERLDGLDGRGEGDERSGRVARLVMERGDRPLNVFRPPKLEAMAAAVEALADEVDCLVVYGEGEFSAGADLEFIREAPTEMRSVTIDTIAAASSRYIRAVREFPGPVISAVTGIAAGGGLGFMLASDLNYLHESATLDTAFARIGLTPDNAISFFLVKTVGPYKARELLFDPEPIDAAEAVDLGFANATYGGSAEEFLETVTDRARELAAGPTDVHAETKTLVDASYEGRLSQHLEQERTAIKRMSGTDTFDEGLAAFLDGREPEWD